MHDFSPPPSNWRAFSQTVSFWSINIHLTWLPDSPLSSRFTHGNPKYAFHFFVRLSFSLLVHLQVPPFLFSRPFSFRNGSSFPFLYPCSVSSLSHSHLINQLGRYYSRPLNFFLFWFSTFLLFIHIVHFLVAEKPKRKEWKRRRKTFEILNFMSWLEKETARSVLYRSFPTLLWVLCLWNKGFAEPQISISLLSFFPWIWNTVWFY